MPAGNESSTFQIELGNQNSQPSDNHRAHRHSLLESTERRNYILQVCIVHYITNYILRVMLSFVQFKKREIHPQSSVTFKLQHATFLKSKTSIWVFFTFFKASHMLYYIPNITSNITLLIIRYTIYVLFVYNLYVRLIICSMSPDISYSEFSCKQLSNFPIFNGNLFLEVKE